ncbi:MAG TPA: DUF5715 family protein, partial [Longimicrobiaceae bacterium]|nr:DUF5715 family protein [Longimicrobiaceae bacterium]
MRIWMAAGLAGLLAAGGCGRGGDDGPSDASAERPATAQAQPAPPAPEPPATAADSAEARARVAFRHDSVVAAFARASALGASEVAKLRQDVNATQVATARTMGIRASGEAEIQRLAREGRLVALGDSTAFWVLRGMDHSVPYVTPDARAMLMEIGRRFHARLDSLGLPRYRMKVTSAIRTDATQADLRRTNSYASRTVSAHEFGTTVDVSHERFAVPADARPARAGTRSAVEREMEEEMLEEVGKENAKALQAALGRAVADLRDQEALHVMMENKQPVYHMTVRRRL